MLHRIVNSIITRTVSAAGYAPLFSSSSSPSQSSFGTDESSSHSPIERPQSSQDPEWTDEKPTPAQQNRAGRCLRFLDPVPVLRALIPSFLQNNGSDASAERRLSSTAWLDGLRGLAALTVVFHHSSLLFFQWDIYNGPVSEHNLIIQWPFFRLLVSGFPCVCVFFVVSGYALSYRPLTLLSTNQHSAFYSSLSSSVFRRHPRLFLPASAASLFSAILCAMGLFGTDDQVLPNAAQAYRSPPRMDNIFLQLENWAQNALKLANPMEFPISGRMGSEYDPNLWTIPVEFKASLVIFLLLAATARFNPRARLLAFWAVLAWAFWGTYYALFLFVGGMALAEMRVHEEVAAAPTPDRGIIATDGPKKPASFWARRTTLARALTITAFLACLYILGVPEWGRGFPDSGFGYATIATWIPKRYHDAGRADAFFPIIGSFFLVLIVDRNPHLQRLFTSQFSQYMGRISFSLYLVHGPILYTAARPLAVALTKKFGQESLAGYGAGIVLTVVTVAPLLVVVADAGSRLVDQKAVSISRNAYNWMTGRSK